MWHFITEYYYLIAPIITIILTTFGIGMMTGEGAGIFSGLLEDFIKKIPLIVILSIFLYGLFYYCYEPEMSKSEALEISQCKLIEENINNGFFSRNTNKLDCDGVIKNVTVSDYDKAIENQKENK